MARQRDYAAEYRRRIERGMATGKTRQQAAGHGSGGSAAYQQRKAAAQRNWGTSSLKEVTKRRRTLHELVDRFNAGTGEGERHEDAKKTYKEAESWVRTTSYQHAVRVLEGMIRARHSYAFGREGDANSEYQNTVRLEPRLSKDPEQFWWYH